MESMVNSFWQGKKVLVTGHTGFKGSWLSLWLLNLGAQVKGLSLEPNTNPSLFEQLNLAQELDHVIGDIRDLELIQATVTSWQPDLIFHLAAQPLVRLSYTESVETWNTNVMGTIHILESLKTLSNPCALVSITTDKCYENREWVYGYRENDPLGGHDPYSSSKAGAELAISSWRSSFFNKSDNPIAIASARAGNVIGGGDWAQDRILPDAMRSLTKAESIPVRNPRSTRPWQHVLEPLSGYLTLAERIYQTLGSNEPQQLQSAFNFGPALDSNRTVKELVEAILEHWSGSWIDCSDPNAPHEAKLLNLITDKAFHLLNWQPVWNFSQTVEKTVNWYKQASTIADKDHSAFRQLTLEQIDQYQEQKINN
ncbi:MAG: CDP-glucose 4,6-dehydratase [Cyanobacteriota bacterium ELA615]